LSVLTTRKLFQNKLIRQTAFIGTLLLVWELIARSGIYPALLFPSITGILQAIVSEHMELMQKTQFSLALIGISLGIDIAAAFVLSGLAIASRTFAEMLMSIMAIMHPLPGIALLPIILLWFGSGSESIVAIIIFSALWPLIANILAGLKAVPQAQIEVGRNLGLQGLPLVMKVMIPAALPHILTGLRIGWARAWQSSVAAEMVFGAAGGEGGLGWFLYKERFMMDTAGVFAGMAIIILIGILVEHLIFAALEQQTIKKWRMSAE